MNHGCSRAARPGSLRLGLQSRTSQVVEQQIAFGSEQIPPTLGQMTLEGLFMFQRFVQCPVESVLGGHSVIGSQHHVHGGRRVPALVNAQFTLWSHQAING